MSKVRTFSAPDDWKCLDNLLEKLPRSVDISGAVRMSVESFYKTVESKPTVTLDTFKTETTIPELNIDPKTWKKLLKDMSIEDIRELQTLMNKRKSLVDDEIYRRTL